MALTAWVNEKKKIDHYKTVDNIKPAKDFAELEKKLSAVELLTITEIEYPRVFSVYHPNDTLKYNRELGKLRELITLNDKSLASYPSYRRLVLSLLDKEARQKGESFLSTLMREVPEGAVRNYIAFDQVGNILALLADSTRREYLMEKSMEIITDEKLKQKLISIYKRTKHFQRGKKAPDFIAEGLSGTAYSLASLANRYVIIDVWASWCIPCKNENPYFEQYADQYTNERIAFVSISIDQDKHAWLREAGQRSRRVLQLWARNAQQTFAEDYAIAAIPRFILIDPKGNILNAEFPRPSDPNFEIQLQNEIPSLRLTSY
jgi:thiol-disulfide isomerase/thioredoxin